MTDRLNQQLLLPCHYRISFSGILLLLLLEEDVWQKLWSWWCHGVLMKLVQLQLWEMQWDQQLQGSQLHHQPLSLIHIPVQSMPIWRRSDCWQLSPAGQSPTINISSPLNNSTRQIKMPEGRSIIRRFIHKLMSQGCAPWESWQGVLLECIKHSWDFEIEHDSNHVNQTSLVTFPVAPWFVKHWLHFLWLINLWNVILWSTPGFSFFSKLSCDEETLSSCIIVIKRSTTYLSEIAEKSPQEVAEEKKKSPHGIAEKSPQEIHVLARIIF